MATIASPAACVAAVAALLLSGIGVGLPSDSASAEDNCVSAPGAAAPQGQHWYYRIDRVKQRKCWYLHGLLAQPNHAAAQHRAAPAEPADSDSVAAAPIPFAVMPQLRFGPTPQATNAAPGPAPAADPPNDIAGTAPGPHVTMLTVKPAPALSADTTSASQAAIPEQADEPPMPQIAPNDANAPADRQREPASGPIPAAAPGATGAAHHALAPAETAAVAAPVRTQSADLFFLLALALGIAAALLALCGKMAGLSRAPRLSDHPDDDWRRIIAEEDAPFLAPSAPHGPSESNALKRMEQSPPGRTDFLAAQSRNGEPRQSERVAPTRKDIELALRALQEARQSIARTSPGATPAVADV